MKKLLIVLAITLAGCTNANKSFRALESAGYTEINMTGYAFLGCDENDVVHDGFVAKGANGKSVDGVVCSGWFKGSTIRLN